MLHPHAHARDRRGLRLATSVMALATLQACAVNPLVRVEPKPAPDKQAQTRTMLDDAKLDLNVRREAYRAKINEFVGASAGTSTALIGLGSLIAVLAASKGVHRDAILGASVVGGTGLLLGNWNLDRRRLVIYHATVAAFNCAERAAAPMNMRTVDYEKLQEALVNLTAAQTEASDAVAQLEVEVERWTRDKIGIELAAKPFVDTLVAGKAALAAAEAVSQAGYTLADRAQSAGEMLRDAALRIDADADKALSDTLGDLNKVTDVIAMVANASGSFAPGSGVESALTQALKKTLSAGAGDNQAASNVVPPSAVTAARAKLDGAMVRLGTTSAIVQNRVKAQASRATADQLSDCGIGEGHLAVALDPPKIVVPANTAWKAVVEITGGKAPFVVKPNGIANSDVKVTGPDRMGRTFDVDIPANKLASAQVLNYRVLDSSSPTKALSFAIEVTGASAPAPAPAPPPADPAAAPSPAPSLGDVPLPKGAANAAKAAAPKPPGNANVTAGVTALTKLNKPLEVNGVAVQFAGTPALAADGKSIRVTVACTTSTPLPQSALRAKVIEQLGDKKGLLDGVPLQFANVANGQSCAAGT